MQHTRNTSTKCEIHFFIRHLESGIIWEIVTSAHYRSFNCVQRPTERPRVSGKPSRTADRAPLRPASLANQIIEAVQGVLARRTFH